MKIEHPSIKDYNLNLESLIGPENAVFYRGRVRNESVIELPRYWEDLVEKRSISVHLTPVGSHQNVIVKRVGENKVILQANGGMPIDCYYFVIGQRKDVPPFDVEESVDTDA